MDENVADVVVMRIKAKDKDLEFSDNWEAVFEIVTGNEDHLFSIETDKKTNEGVLKLIKVCSNHTSHYFQQSLKVSTHY